MFQRRVLDLVGQVASTFGFQFWCWYPAGKYQAIQPSINPLEKGAWGTVPLYNASFLFVPPDAEGAAQRKGEWLLEVLVAPDTGFTERGKSEANPADFPDPAQCESRLKLYAFIVLRDMKKNWVFGIYEKTSWPEQDGIAETDDNGVRVIGLQANLARLADRDAVRALVDRFREMVKREGGVV
jgi:hypothetical protein